MIGLSGQQVHHLTRRGGQLTIIVGDVEYDDLLLAGRGAGRIDNLGTTDLGPRVDCAVEGSACRSK